LIPQSEDAARGAFARFANEAISPYAAASDAAGAIRPECIEAIRSAGYLGAFLPRDVGGLGLDAVSYGLLTCEMARACSSCRTLMTVHDMVGSAILRWGSRELRSEILPQLATGSLIAAFALSEADAGSDAAAMRATIRRQGEDLILDGVKSWVSYGQTANLFLVFGRSEEGITAVLVSGEQPGITRRAVTEMVGTRAAMMADVRFEACRLSPHSIVGKPGFGLTHIAQTALDHGRYSVGWGAVGIIDAAFAACTAFVRERCQFGTPLVTQPQIRVHLTRMAALARASRLMCREAGLLRQARAPEAIIETMLAKYFAAKSAVSAANAAVQIHGARGLLRSGKPERLLRDAKVTEIIEGTAEMLELLIGEQVSSLGYPI
jgi:glutaryl-CoA dehydrogenase (non-decarboxylating)